MKTKGLKSVSMASIAAVIVAIVAPLAAVNRADAANLGQAMLKLDRMSASTTTGGTVCAKSTTTDVETSVKVTFPSGFTVNTTAANWTTTTTNLPSGSTPWIGIGTATLASGQDVTFPSGDMVVGTLYCFNFSDTNTLTNGIAGNNQVGAVTTEKAGPTAIDTASYATAIISNDQVIVNATVPPNFSFALNSNALTFPSLSTTEASTTSSVTGTVTTNANNGWVAWVKSATGTLTSASTGAAIPAVVTANDNATTLLTGANYGYGLNVAFTDSATAGTGAVSQAANYGQEYADAVSSAGTLETVFRPIAAAAGVTDGDTVVLTPRARVTSIQQAATDYTDTLTVIAAGRF
jgi:hypothetical protein